MKTGDCSSVTPGETLNSWQRAGLNLVSSFGGRDVVLAIDLTGSVEFNDQGRIRLRQIIEDSLRPGDTVYVIPFASEIKPTVGGNKPFANPIRFEGKQDVEKILSVIPWESNPNIRNTDIQRAELSIYQGIARLNQCRLSDGEGVKSQSVVWITDAPLNTKAGIDSNTWIETPADSPFRVASSPESVEREKWLSALPLNTREKSLSKTTDLSIVDVPATVQEFCTPAPGGKESCLINSYLIGKLWLPGLICGIGLIGAVALLRHFISLATPWELEIKFDSDEEREKQKCRLKNKQRIPIGDDGFNSIYCPGEDVRGYLERRGNKLFLKPTQQAPILYKDEEVTRPIEIQNSILRIDCPQNQQPFDLTIQVNRK